MRSSTLRTWASPFVSWFLRLLIFDCRLDASRSIPSTRDFVIRPFASRSLADARSSFVFASSEFARSNSDWYLIFWELNVPLLA